MPRGASDLIGRVNTFVAGLVMDHRHSIDLWNLPLAPVGLAHLLLQAHRTSRRERIVRFTVSVHDK